MIDSLRNSMACVAPGLLLFVAAFGCATGTPLSSGSVSLMTRDVSVAPVQSTNVIEARPPYRSSDSSTGQDSASTDTYPTAPFEGDTVILYDGSGKTHKVQPHIPGRRALAGHSQRSDISITAIAALDSISTVPWIVQWDIGTGLPSRLAGKSTARLNAGPVNLATEFLIDNASIVTGLPTAENNGGVEFILADTNWIGNRTNVRFVMRYRGLPLEGSGVVVSVNDSGEVVEVRASRCRLEPFQKPGSPEYARILQILRKYYDSDSVLFTEDNVSICLTCITDPKARLTYKVHASIKRRGERHAQLMAILIDTRDGTVLSSGNLYSWH